MDNEGFNLTGNRILVTGAAGGIGQATARVLAKQGASLVLTDLKEPPATLMEDLGPDAVWRSLDVGNRKAVEAIAREFSDVEVLVLGAGILPFDDWNANDWDDAFDRVMATNVKGVLNFARAYMPLMSDRKSGRMVVIGSASGRMGGMQAGPHYVASKGAVHALVRWLALKGAVDGVVVNGIAPGSADTDLLKGQDFTAARVPLGRLARPDEIAWPIAFLCSPAASFMCGAVLDVNGGLIVS